MSQYRHIWSICIVVQVGLQVSCLYCVVNVKRQTLVHLFSYIQVGLHVLYTYPTLRDLVWWVADGEGESPVTLHYIGN